MKIFLLMIVCSFLLFSCSEQDDKLTNAYWVKYKKSQPNYLVKFNTNGKYVNFNKLTQSYSYQVIQNRIIITDSKGEKQKFFIKSLTANELKLSEIDDAGSSDIDYFKKAEMIDHFLGTWIKISKGNHFNLYLLANGKGVLEEDNNGYIGKKAIKYSIKDKNILLIDSTEYKFKFSNDLINLELIGKDGQMISLTREM